MTRAKRALFAAASLALGTLLAAGLAEAIFRLVDPPPRVAGFRDAVVDARGVPRWAAGSNGDRLGRQTCPRTGHEGTVIAAVGTSILFGATLPVDDTFAPDLQVAIPGSCVSNHAVPGFGPDQVWSSLVEVVDAEQPDLVWWEHWDPSRAYVALDGTAWDLRGFALDDQGYPHLPHAPTGPSRLAFRWSHAWRYATLALAERKPEDERIAYDRLCTTLWPDAVRRLEAVGGRLAIVVPVLLDRTIEPIPYSPDMPAAAGLACAERLGIPVVRLDEELAGTDPAPIRLDTCCHFNAAGHDRIAAILTRHSLRILGR